MIATDYQLQAKQWLSEHGLNLRITLSNTKPANWEPSGNHYRVTLTREAVKGARLVFDFWGSLNDMEKGEDPGAYDVLACISGDVNTPDTFKEFCSEYGYEADSIKALQTFRRADRFAKRLREFLTEEERETITAIR